MTEKEEIGFGVMLIIFGMAYVNEQYGSGHVLILILSILCGCLFLK